MKDQISEFLDEFRETLASCERFCYAARAKEYQIASIEELRSLKTRIAGMKTRAIEKLDEDSANCLLSLELSASMLEHELQMWVALKDDNPAQAWSELVEAEGAGMSAIRAHHVSGDLAYYVEKFGLLEKLLFPPLMFMSPGMIILESHCSICGGEYGECDHIKGMPYVGQICSRVITKAEAREVSFTPNPANKHARVVIISDGEVNRDFLSWRVLSNESIDPLKDK